METREKLKRILLEWSDFELPNLSEREFDHNLLKGDEILSIIGARRSGKTYLCYQLIKYLRAETAPDNLLYINLEDERLSPLKGDELSLFWDIYLELFHVDLSKKIYLFMDEVQNIKNWSKWARRITEQHKNVKLIITGSSSKLLSQEIATELRGRNLSFTVYPFSFKEYLKALNVSAGDKNRLYSKEGIIIKKHFNAYCKMGGFPATVNNENADKLLKEYYQVMFYRDLIERHKIKNIKLLEDYLTLLMDQAGTLFSISSTARKLEEFGHSFSKNTLSNFSRYAREIFLIFEVNKHSYRVKEQIINPKKIYAIDHGLLQAIRFSFSGDYGRILENIVHLELRRRGKNLFYFNDGKECDFLVCEKGKVALALQVCASLSNEKTKEREVSGLLRAMEAHSLKEGLILTENDSDTLEAGNKIIKLLPVWHWLLF